MRSTSYSYTSHASPYAVSPYSSQSSSSGLSSFSSRPTTAGIHSTSTYGTKRFPSSTSSASSSTDQNFAPFDYGQVVCPSSKPTSASSRRPASRSSSLASSTNEHRSSETSADKGNQWRQKKEKDGSSLVNGSQWLSGRSGLKGPTENNNSVRRNFGVSNGDGSIKVDSNNQVYGTVYRKTSLDSDSLAIRNFNPPSDDYRRAPSRQQSAPSSETYEAMLNAAVAASQRTAPAQRTYLTQDSSTVDQQIFLKRLLQAHSVVDDMLRSRGMNPDDERAYLHFLKHVPESHEEEQPLSEVVRSSSASGSDSGLSLDNDSEDSIHAEYIAPKMPLEESVDVENAFVNGDVKEELVELLLLYKQVVYESNAVTAKLGKKLSKKHSKQNVSSKKNPTDEENFKYGKTKDSAINVKKMPRMTVSQRTLEALLQHQRKTRGSAEISIQHVSFYQLAESLTEKKPVEKAVRIHFRLTQRHHASLKTAIKLTQSNRTAHATLNLKEPGRQARKYRRKTIEIAELENLQAPLSPTLLRKTVPAHARKNINTLNHVRIPESFLKRLNPFTETTKTMKCEDSDEALRIARCNLKRVAFNQTISAMPADGRRESSGNVTAKDEKQNRNGKNESFKTKAEMNIANSKNLNFKEIKMGRGSEANSSLGQSSVNEKRQLSHAVTTAVSEQPAAENTYYKGVIKAEAAFSKDKIQRAESQDERWNLPKNKQRTLRRSQTCISDEDVRKALQKAKTNDKTDQTLIYEFRRNKTIPAPQAIIRAELPPIAAQPTRVLNVKPVRDFVAPLPPAKFLRRRTPERFLLETVLGNESPPSKCGTSEVVLKPVNRILKPVSVSNSARPASHASLPVGRVPSQQTPCGTVESPFGVHLKRVDRHEIKNCSRGAVTQSTAKKPWIPKWRRVERSEQEEVEEEEQAEESAEARVYRERGRSLKSGESQQKRRDEKENATMSEAEKAMLAAKRRQLEGDAAKLLSYEQRRHLEREREKEELRVLKEKQERRRQQREEENRAFAEKMRQEEERKRQEKEEWKARVEAEMRKKDEIRKREQLLRASFLAPSGFRNFVIPSKIDRAGKFGNIVQAKQEMGMTREQQEEAKRSFLSSVQRSIAFEGLSHSQLCDKIRYFHQRVSKLEASKYDLEIRHERQEYDLKELNERQRQMARNKALKKTIDPLDALSDRYPPKVSIASKYDRQVDRRDFLQRRAIFENENALPCFPNVPPPPPLYRKVALTFDAKRYTEED